MSSGNKSNEGNKPGKRGVCRDLEKGPPLAGVVGEGLSGEMTAESRPGEQEPAGRGEVTGKAVEAVGTASAKAQRQGQA